MKSSDLDLSDLPGSTRAWKDDVLRIDTGSVNCYLCRDADGYTLIDAATPGKADLIFERLAEFGGRPTDLKRIIITHADFDHAGSAAAIQARSGATIYAGAETTALLAEGCSPDHLPWLIQVLSSRFMRYSAVSGNGLRVIAEGDELPVLGGLRVLAAPGHTLDQYAFYSPSSGILFAADALNTRGDRLQSTPSFISADTVAAEQTTKRLLELSPTVIACGHGAPLTDDTTAVANLLARVTQPQSTLPRG